MNANPTQSPIALTSFLKTVPGFNKLSDQKLGQLAQQLQPLRYPMGRAIFTNKLLPTQLSIIYQGQVRLLGYDPRTGNPITLQFLEPGETVGWLGLLCNRPMETAIASTETICLTLPAEAFLKLMAQEPELAQLYQQQPSVLEVVEILGKQLLQRADGGTDLKKITLEAWPGAALRLRSILPFNGLLAAAPLTPKLVVRLILLRPKPGAAPQKPFD
jgi:ATP-binding cassette, subfamily B, bacterial HlyB/CyaB